MARKYFGTDGVRGTVGEFPITPDFVLKLGWAAGQVLAAHGGSKILIRKDTRISGYMFEAALEAGISAAGVDVRLLGPLPTPGIAYLTRTLSAQAGIEIVLIDATQEGADKGKKHCTDHFAKGVARGKLSQDKADKLGGLITPTTDYTAIKDVDLVVEAVFENSELKAKITKMAEEQIGTTAVFGSNTSSIPITDLAKASDRPDNFIGIHFFSPVEKMNLVEIIMGEKTGDYALSRTIDFVTKIKKTPIVGSDTRGF